MERDFDSIRSGTEFPGALDYLSALLTAVNESTAADSL